MKPRNSALIGALVIGGAISFPGVAFAETATKLATSEGAKSRPMTTVYGHGEAGAGQCSESSHAHGAACGCAKCAADRAE